MVALAPGRRPVGRPDLSLVPDERRKLLAVLYAKQETRTKNRALAMACEVSPRTIKRWAARARRFPEALTSQALASAIGLDS